MADLVIRGMEMPRDCSVCALSQKRVFANSVMCSITGQTVGYYDQGFHLEKHDCHLLPLPEGHGRLGDLDALEAKLREEALQHTLIGDLNRMTLGVGEVIDRIRMAKTIVPAEGSVNYGT